MAGGLVASIVVIAVGAVLDFAVTTNPDQHGFNVQTIGVILLIVGCVGAVLSIIGLLVVSMPRRHRTTASDDRGTIVRRDDTYL